MGWGKSEYQDPKAGRCFDRKMEDGKTMEAE
jgi:hypothetical protein